MIKTAKTLNNILIGALLGTMCLLSTPGAIEAATTQVVPALSTTVDYTRDYAIDAEILAKSIDIADKADKTDKADQAGQTEVLFGRHPILRAGAFVIRGAAKVIRGTLYVGGKALRGLGKVITREAYTITVTLKGGQTVSFVRYGQLPQWVVGRMWANANFDNVLNVWGYSTYDGKTYFRMAILRQDIVNITAVRATVVFQCNQCR